MERLGTNYGGWIVPDNMKLDVVYSGGVGEDMSFDIKLQTKYDCDIILIDPTTKAVKHFEECQKYFNDKSFKFTGGIQDDYYTSIKNEQPNLNKFFYVQKGLWDQKDQLKFFRQDNENYVSQSLIDGMFSKNYDIVEVDTIKNLMEANGHDHIDLLKLDIEGAEIKVINKMLDDGILPKYLCIEFDLYLKQKDRDGSTRMLFERLEKMGYVIIANENMNVTFRR
jgi:FkbM family methyltransferase